MRLCYTSSFSGVIFIKNPCFFYFFVDFWLFLHLFLSIFIKKLLPKTNWGRSMLPVRFLQIHFFVVFSKSALNKTNILLHKNEKFSHVFRSKFWQKRTRFFPFFSKPTKNSWKTLFFARFWGGTPQKRAKIHNTQMTKHTAIDIS